MINKTKSLSINDRAIVTNVVNSFVIRGGSLLVSLFTMPAYFKFFQDNNVLGIWFTILSVINWVLIFDLGLGNGLRNKLPKCFVEGDKTKAKEYIASTYAGTIIVIFFWFIIGIIVIQIVNWNSFLNIDENIINIRVLKICIAVVFFGVIMQLLLKTITSILYAIQKSAIVNLLSFISSLLTLVLISIVPNAGIEKNLIHMAIVNVISANMPYLLTTVILFKTELKEYVPKVQNISMLRIKEVLNIGITLLWLTLIWMIISSTNELLITKLTNSSYAVEFQVYYKIFNTVSSVFTLALVPIWSAVTKASAEKRYKWIKELYGKLLLLAITVFIVELIVVPFMQILVNLWLKEDAITINYNIAIIFAISSSIFFLHNVNTSVGNGMSFFKVQKIWMTFAAIVNIPLAYFFVRVIESWVGVIIANIISLLPFEIIEIFSFYKMMNNICYKEQEERLL